MNTTHHTLHSLVRLLSFVLPIVAITVLSLRQSVAQCPSCSTSQVDWTTLPSTYTHNSYGQRVDQYSQPVQPVSNDRPDFQRSGYRNYRSSLQVGTTADNFHVVEQWGSPVQPYGEWRFPYRPYSVPYGEWGPQYPAVGVFPGVGGFGGYGAGGGGYGAGGSFGNASGANSYGGYGNMGNPMSGPRNGMYAPNGYPNLPGIPPVGVPGGGMPPSGPSSYNNYQAPWIDGYHQNAPVEPLLPDAQFFARPPR